jgi:ATP-dependent DNA helicase RecG
VYQRVGQKSAYVRQVGFDPIQQEQMVLAYIDKHGSIKRADVMDLCRITKDQAYKLLNRLKNNDQIVQTGTRKGATYERKR